jgi:hypothetical protein
MVSSLKHQGTGHYFGADTATNSSGTRHTPGTAVHPPQGGSFSVPLLDTASEISLGQACILDISKDTQTLNQRENNKAQNQTRSELRQAKH